MLSNIKKIRAVLRTHAKPALLRLVILLRLMLLVLLSALQPAMQVGLSNPPAAVHLRVASRRGSDSTGTGTTVAPFATLQRAQQAPHPHHSAQCPQAPQKRMKCKKTLSKVHTRHVSE